MSDIEDTVRETICFITGNCTPKEEILDEQEYKDVLMYDEDSSLQCYQHINKIKEENELEDIPQEPRVVGLQCAFCNNSIVRYYYTCVQCPNYELCNICESRELHSYHYMLRVPRIQPYTEIREMLDLIRMHLFSKAIPFKSNTADNKLAFKTNSDEFLKKQSSDDSLQKQSSDDFVQKQSSNDFLQTQSSNESLLRTTGDELLLKTDSDEDDNNYILKSNVDTFPLKSYDDDNENTHYYERNLNDLEQNEVDQKEPPQKNTNVHIKKPLNAFMLYIKEMRPSVFAECNHKDASTVNQILGRRWHALSKEEQAKYYDMARLERQRHRQLYPNWKSKGRIRIHRLNKTKQKKKNFQKCRAKYGINQRHLWCKPCLRKKKCQQYILALAAATSP